MTKTRRNVSTSVSADVIDFLCNRGHSQVAIARMLGVSEPFVSLVRSRERALTLEHLQRVAFELDMPLGAMLVAVTPKPADASPEVERLYDVTERLMLKADVAIAACRAAVATRRK